MLIHHFWRMNLLMFCWIGILGGLSLSFSLVRIWIEQLTQQHPLASLKMSLFLFWFFFCSWFLFWQSSFHRGLNLTIDSFRHLITWRSYVFHFRSLKSWRPMKVFLNWLFSIFSSPPASSSFSFTILDNLHFDSTRWSPWAGFPVASEYKAQCTSLRQCHRTGWSPHL